jgi:hypothetical protein
MYHGSEACAMMPREDRGVVDPKLEIYGTKKLRVVDASIFVGASRQYLSNGICGRRKGC